jgi:hypothetical protein
MLTLYITALVLDDEPLSLFTGVTTRISASDTAECVPSTLRIIAPGLIGKNTVLYSSVAPHKMSLCYSSSISTLPRLS